MLLIIALCAGLLYWQQAMKCKEQALYAARKECKICGVQLLDQTVQQARISLSRDEQGRWRIWRVYRFDYTETGQERFSGTITLLGQKVLRIALETFNPVIH